MSDDTESAPRSKQWGGLLRNDESEVGILGRPPNRPSGRPRSSEEPAAKKRITGQVVPIGEVVAHKRKTRVSGVKRLWLICYTGDEVHDLLYCMNRTELETCAWLRTFVYRRCRDAMKKAARLNTLFGTDKFVVHAITTTTLVTEATIEKTRKANRVWSDHQHYLRVRDRREARRQERLRLKRQEFWRIEDYDTVEK